ncbi:MAG TPA: DUF2064 domain-containing protein [Microlunatus sp.]|nr:DUF2064 domain-containing protein [Microlunatus sp.]
MAAQTDEPAPEATSADTVLVLAKQPLPGRAKTRLQAAFTPVETASLASAALGDTLAAVRASRIRRRVLVFDGDPTGWEDGLEVMSQGPGNLAERLAAAFRDSGAAHHPEERVLLIGMDTPQVTPGLLESSWGRADAVLGLSEDGGYWAIGLRGVDPAAVFAGIEMSTERTGAAQLGRLIDLGLSVALLPPLRDVDLPADADAVADHWPDLRFSRRHQELTGTRPRQPTDRLFDDLYGGADVAVHTVSGRVGGATLEIDLGRWTRPADHVDEMVVARCEPPVLDIGCGPGRMVAALQRSGRAALGIDISAVAVAVGRRAGGQVLRRDLALPLAGEGRWGTTLLLDGNIGIGGDVPALLRRCRQIVGGGGLIISEIDTDPGRDEAYEVVLSRPGCESAPIPWAAIGVGPLLRVAAALDLIVTEVWEADRRCFVALRTAS